MRNFTIVVLGAGGVGKSALTVRFIRNEFLENYDPTIEESYQRDVEVDGIMTRLEVLDTAGADQFVSIKEMYMQRGSGFLIVFSLTQETSLRDADNVRQQIFQIKGHTSVPIVVVGTKLDLANEREVSRQAIQDLASRWNLPVYETSAKRNWQVQEVFFDLVRQMRLAFPEPVDKLERKKKKKDNKCIIV